MSDDTKQCPYCAETIKAEAVVCRFCGQDLTLSPKKEKKSNKKLLFGIMGVVLLVCCAVFSLSQPSPNSSTSEPISNISEQSDNSKNTPQPTSTPQPTPTPQPTAPPIEEILATVENMTDAQRNKYNESIEGSRVEKWQGTVSDVDEGEFFGGFTVYVDMVDDNLGSEVHIDVSEEVALSLSKGQKIVFSGNIKSVSDILGTTVFIENVTIQPAE